MISPKEMERMLSNLVLFENRDGIGLLTMNNPDSMNIFDSEMMQALHDKLDEIMQENLKALIITGAGRAFVAGASIKEMSELSPSEALEFGQLGHKTFWKIETMPWPTIAMINGFALGGGSELALACDLRFASEKAKIGQPEVTLGICPGYGGTQRLTQLVGPSKAKDLIFTGRIITAQEALDLGWVDRVFSPEELEAKTWEYAEGLKKSSAHAIARSKEAIQAGLRGAEGYEKELKEFAMCFEHHDQQEGMRAFIEKRPPEFK